MARHCWIAAALLLVVSGLAGAADQEADLAVQGEYSGDVDDGNNVQKFGVQVIALGDGKFRSVAYPGGLPGDGWKKEEGTIEGETERAADGTVTFKDPNGSVQGEAKDGALIVSDPNNANVKGRLEKVTRKSDTLGATPPEGAIVLFDGGKGVNDFDKKATDDKLLPAGANSKRKHGSCTLHVEFLLPFEPKGRGQGRGNSGVYLQGRYEVQVLDSFGLAGKNNECGGIYGVSDPAVNMCYPPGAWQTYDIEFTAAEWKDGKKVANARMTVRHNGVVVQKDVEVPKPTTAAPVKETQEPGILHLQDHGHPVRYRNVWLVEKK
jgi:hypothetical protein